MTLPHNKKIPPSKEQKNKSVFSPVWTKSSTPFDVWARNPLPIPFPALGMGWPLFPHLQLSQGLVHSLSSGVVNGSFEFGWGICASGITKKG